MRIAKTALFLILVLALALVTIRVFLLDRLTAIALEKAGAQDISVHLSGFGFEQAHIDHLTATFKLPTGELLPVTLKDISLQYKLQQLLKTGKSNQVTIKTMEISRTAIKKHPEAPLSLPGQISLLKDDLRSRLPIERLRIQQLRLHGDRPPQLTAGDIQLDVSITGTAITAAISMQMHENTLVTIDLLSADSVHATANIIGRQGQDQILQARLALKADELAGTVALQLKPVRDLVLQSVKTTVLPEIDGHMNGNFTIPLPVPATSNVQAEFTLLDNKEHQLHLQMNVTPNSKKVSLIFSGQKKEQKFLNTELTISDQRISGSYLLQAAPLHRFLKPYLQQPLPEITGKLEGTLDLHFSDSKNKSFTATARATVPAMPGFSASSAQVGLTGEVTDKTILLDRDAKLHAKGLVIGKTGIEELSMELAGNYRWLENRLLIDFTQQQDIQIKGLSTGKLHIANIQLQPQKALQLFFHKRSWSVAANTIHVRPLLIAEGQRSYSTGPLLCRLTSLENSGSGAILSSEIETPSAVFQDKTLKMPLKDLSATIQLKDNLFSGGLQVSPETIPGKIKANVKHNIDAAAGSFNLRTDRPLDLNREEASLSLLFTPWQYPFDLDSGWVSIKALGSWAPHKAFQLSTLATVTKASGYYKLFLFNGLDAEQDLAVLPRLYSKTEGSFSLQHLIGGIDVHDAHAGLSFLSVKNETLPQVQINDFSASLFDGTITSPTIIYDLNQPDSSFTVNIRNMNLNTLIKLIKMDSLHVTGRISGAIPVTIKEKEISVEKGELYSEQPGGEIRYTPENMNPAGITGYALKAVENFRYDSLKTTARYLPSGQLDLDIGLQGISPGLETSRPVHLNIHAEQNLPALLQSLRFSKGLTEELDKRLKEHYK